MQNTWAPPGFASDTPPRPARAGGSRGAPDAVTPPDPAYLVGKDEEADTDPSSPTARASRSSGHLAAAPAPRIAPVEPRDSDSVDALLSSIPRRSSPPPELAQSDGKDKAVYHGEHRIPAARTSHEEDAKVVVAPSAAAQTLRLGRLGRVGPVGPGAAQDVEGRMAHDPTVAAAPGIAGRVALAIVAALGVVVTVFVVLRTMATPPSGTPSPTPTLTLTPTPTPSPSPTLTPTPNLTHTPNLIPSPSPTPTPSPPPAPTFPVPAPSARTPRAKHPPPSPSQQAPAGGDLGEFKTTF